jgi:hypothetical protein
VSNYWLYNKLKEIQHLDVDSNHSKLVTVKCYGIEHKIYTPSSAEYLITIDIVQKVIEMGGDTISYATAWCEASREAIIYGKQNGISVLPHGALFKKLSEF